MSTSAALDPLEDAPEARVLSSTAPDLNLLKLVPQLEFCLGEGLYVAAVAVHKAVGVAEVAKVRGINVVAGLQLDRFAVVAPDAGCRTLEAFRLPVPWLNRASKAVPTLLWVSENVNRWNELNYQKKYI